ncbi:hypothetical protein I6F36_22970 [Bradyrhizobium sp. BRP19]|uniref:hypothetical protein n=1 Tax=Bradyrhizobium sp. BRP19 TaxID=2793823 RepID=UPI001CD53734|nr:hypothetical protein [Bradyrhizobium sp. BRP19]MCA1549698.1 hypothetical protein [Bradyrhizobium sp. BRP19]
MLLPERPWDALFFLIAGLFCQNAYAADQKTCEQLCLDRAKSCFVIQDHNALLSAALAEFRRNLVTPTSFVLRSDDLRKAFAVEDDHCNRGDIIVYERSMQNVGPICSIKFSVQPIRLLSIPAEIRLPHYLEAAVERDTDKVVISFGAHRGPNLSLGGSLLEYLLTGDLVEAALTTDAALLTIQPKYGSATCIEYGLKPIHRRTK